MEFHYRIVGTGWASAKVADGDNELEITASYLSDALGDLLRAVIAVVEGAESATCSWEVEPGEFR